MNDNDPGRVDEAVRAAIHTCWHALPPERRNLDELEQEVRRLVDRAFRDIREDAERFGVRAAVEQDDDLPED